MCILHTHQTSDNLLRRGVSADVFKQKANELWEKQDYITPVTSLKMVVSVQHQNRQDYLYRNNM